MSQPLSRRRFFLNWAGLFLSLSGAAYWFRLEAEALETVTLELPLRNLRAPVRLVQLSDFHASPAVRNAFLSSAVATAIAAKPDLICLTGDYTTAGLRDWDPLLDVLRPLAAAAPTFACLGNHDGPPVGTGSLQDQTLEALRAVNISVLHNEGSAFAVRDAALHIVGTGDYWRGPFDPASAFADQPTGVPTVLLTHNPDARQALRNRSWELALCGHTHGGQINLPGMYGRFAPVRDRRYIAGPYPADGRLLYVNRGLGSIGGVRYGARPEVTVFNLIPLDG